MRKRLRSRGTRSARAWRSTTSASTIARGECLGLVGESGCGKTTLSQDDHARAARPTPAASSSTTAAARSTCSTLRGRELFAVSGAAMQFIFQDPFGSLNPRMTVLRHRQRAAGHPRHRRRATSAPRWSRELMELVGLDAALSQALSAQLLRRPAPAHRHRARAGAAARAADLRRAGLGARRFDPGADPQSAEGSAAELGLTYSVHLAQSRGGRLHRRPHRGDVRAAASSRSRRSELLFRNPLHPYTKALLAAVPEPDLDASARFRPR